ncbi:MAG: hypothetical protein ACR2FN_12145 [Chitinophagaceae bacterium]
MIFFVTSRNNSIKLFLRRTLVLQQFYAAIKSNTLLIFITFSFCIFSNNIFSQDSALIHYLVQRIADQQIKQDNFFLTEIFPSYISNKEKFSSRKKDNNIFFSGLIIYTLKNIQKNLSKKDQLIIDTIFLRSKPLFAKFKNRKGRETYNFWRTDSAYNFPYTNWIRLIKKNTALPDDMDDTVFSLFALSASDSVAEQVHQLMQYYVNSDSSKVRIENSAYKNFQAYSTWFGKNFPVVFDICVMSNILSFVQSYNLNWAKADSASLQFILQVIQTKDYIKNPLLVSPYYGKTSIILYHLSRLMSIKNIPKLEQIKPYLIADAVNEFNQSKNILEKIILCSSIIKFGYNSPLISVPSINQIKNEIEGNDFSFFIGNIPSYLSNTEKTILLEKNFGLFYHYCPAYNDALLLEYLVLKNMN